MALAGFDFEQFDAEIGEAIQKHGTELAPRQQTEPTPEPTPAGAREAKLQQTSDFLAKLDLQLGTGNPTQPV